MVRGHVLDNRWVIPYNTSLLLYFDCHINVEICCDIKVVKYLYKYVHKGHDKVVFKIAAETSVQGLMVDEIANFQNARWVSPVESAWRIFGFPLHGIYPTVLQLQVHLPNFQNVHFEDDDDLESLLQDERLKRSMLTEFFVANASNADVRKLNLLYKQFPRYFVWDSQMRTWTKRKKGAVIDRLAILNPFEGERYYLRVLLNNVRRPTSFTELLTVGGVLCDSFQLDALKRGLLQDDDDIMKTLEEACTFRMPPELRMLFATLLHYRNPTNPKNYSSIFINTWRRISSDIAAN